MESWKALIEWYFGISRAGAGEGTQWRWVMHSLTPSGWPIWLSVVAGLLVVTGLVWSSRRDAATLAPWQRRVLTGLRLGSILLALGLWTQPTLTVARSGLPPVVVLVDTSASMAIRDGQPVGNASSSATASRRWDHLLTAVGNRQGRFLRELQQKHPVRVYQFSTTATPLNPPDHAGSDAATAANTDWLPLLQQLPVDGASTRPAEAVRQVLAELRGMPPAAMIVLTDGIASESEADRLSTVADLVRRRGTTLYVAPVGDSTPPVDLQLFDLVMDEVAFVGDPVLISGKLKSTGLNVGQVQVRVTAGDQAAPLIEQSVPVRSEGGVSQFELTLTPAEAAELDLIIAATPVAGEAVTDNNQEARHLSVREERLSVLLLESAPRYEFRYLKQWLERDQSVTLQTLLLDADPEYAREDRTAVPYFPVQKEDLWRYDVVILGDVSPAMLGATAGDWLTEFVREKGGGVVMIAGLRHNPASFLNTSLEPLLPFSPDDLDLAGFSSASTDAYQPRLTLDGQKGVPMFRFAESELASLEVWNSVPGFYGLLPIRRTKPGVRVLVEHPYAQAERGRLPVILLQQIGNGKVLYHATDETWRWRFRTGDAWFGRYWGQAIRYLSRSRLLGKDRSVELLVDRQTYLQGEPVLLRARFLDDRVTPVQDDGVSVMVERAGGERREVTLTRLPHLPTVFEATLTGLSAGPHHVWLSRPAVTGAPPVTDFRVESQQREIRQQAVDRAELESAAKATGGALVELQDLATLPDELPPGRLIPLEQGRAIPLWSRFEPLLLLGALLITEWTLRRRWRLV